MAYYASSTWPLSFLRLRPKLLSCRSIPLHRNCLIVSATRKKAVKVESDDISDGENKDISSKDSKKQTRRGRPKASKKTTEAVTPVETDTRLTMDQEQLLVESPPENADISSENSKKPTRDSRKRSSKKYAEEIFPPEATAEFNDDPLLKSWNDHSEITTEPASPTEELQAEKFYASNSDPLEEDIDLSFLNDKDEGETENCMLPPLVICFGPAKASFIPYARPAKRLFDQAIHEAMPDMYWSPDQFFRAPGSAASSVAIALARLDGQVEFMGKLGNDSLGNDLFSELDVYGVQTRCTKIDDSAVTSSSHMKLVADRNHLKAKCVDPCAEDTFLKSDINLDVLKEAKMLYFNSSALLDLKSKSTLMEVIRMMKSQGSLIFFDVNLPLPLWHSSEEAQTFLKEAFAISNFIELTQQELDFLCGIEQRITGNKSNVKFVHRSRKRVEEFWHDDLQVLFVTNGTSGVSYYTKQDDQYFVGTEDVQIEPSSCEMSAAGDALVAALMKMLVSEPEMATDPSYLETSIWYAIESGMIAQSLATGESGFYDSYQHDEDQYDQEVTTLEDSEESWLDRA